MKKRIASLVLIITMMICLSPFKSSAQENALVVYETNDFISTVRWHLDGYTLSFWDMAQIGINTPMWRLYNTLNGDMTAVPQWPLQPVLSYQQMNAFETNELAALNLCPTGRYIAYSGREDAMLHGFLSIADLTSGLHTVTDIATYSPASPDGGLMIVWNAQCTAFTATITGPYGADRIYYVTNFAVDLSQVRYEAPYYHTIRGNEYGLGVVHALSQDGSLILYDAGRDARGGLILYDTENPDASVVYVLEDNYQVGKRIKWATFDPRNENHILIFYDNQFLRYDRTSGTLDTILDDAFRSIRDWGEVQDLRISPDGNKVAVVAHNSNSGFSRLYLVDISDIQLYSTPVPTPTSTNTLTPTGTATFTSVDPVLGVGGSTGWNGYGYTRQGGRKRPNELFLI